MKNTKAMEIAKKEAINWHLTLHEAPEDDKLTEQFFEWLEADKLHQDAWQKLELLHMQISEYEAENTTNQVSEESEQIEQHAVPEMSGNKFGFGFKTIGYASVAVAVTLFAVLMAPGIYLGWISDHSTGKAEIREIVLEDQSTVVLGANSAFAVDYAEQGRKVSLLTGVAFFDVKEDPERPFTVSVGEFATNVLGTRFEVRETTSGAEVSVAEGIVEVTLAKPNGDSQETTTRNQLIAGKAIKLESDSPDFQAITSVASNDVAAWRNGELVFKSWPLSEALEVLSRHHNGTIVLGPGTGQTNLVSGVLDLDRPIESLKLLAANHNLQVRELGSWLYVVTSF